MSICTYDEFVAALGVGVKVEKMHGDDTQLRIFNSSGGDQLFIDLESGTIEADLSTKWRAAERDDVSDDFPTQADCDEARAVIAEELEYDWEKAGFSIEEEGSISQYSYITDPDKKKYVLYNVEMKYTATSLEDAVSVIQKVISSETTTIF